MRTIILFLISLVFLTSCDDSDEEPVKEFTPNIKKDTKKRKPFLSHSPYKREETLTNT